MTNITPISSARRVSDEANHWLVSLAEGLTSEEEAQFRVWWQESPIHREVLLEKSKLWDKLDILSELSGIYPLEDVRPKKGRMLVRPAYGVAAAALVIIAGIGLFVYQSDISSRLTESWENIAALINSGDPPQLQRSEQELPDQALYQTAKGEQRTVQLPDGSSFTLNTDSSVSVDYNRSIRSINLQRGEATFDVEHDPLRPFVVSSGRFSVTAVGTVFNVLRDMSGSTSVLVTDGAVRVSVETQVPSPDATPANASAVAGAHMMVSAGQIATLEPTGETVRNLNLSEADERLAWMRGLLVFRGESLSEVLSEVERYTDTKFIIKHDQLKNIRVGGHFRTGDVQGVLVSLREGFGIQSRKLSDDLYELEMN